MQILHGDSRALLAALDPESIDAVVTDPPYELTSGKKGGTGPASVNLASPAGRARIGTGFMGMAWDGSGIANDPTFWALVFRVLKPGAHLLAFGGTRTYHRMTCAIEDAGFEIRDCLMWVYGSGFPKSHNIGKAIDAHLGVERPVLASMPAPCGTKEQIAMGLGWQEDPAITGPGSPEAAQWEGWGSALKPAWEPIVLARKPLAGTLVETVLAHGTGGLNINASRVGDEPVTINRFVDGMKPFGEGAGHEYTSALSNGRWPANFIHDGSDAVVLQFPDIDAHKFFYCAKPSRAERDYGCEHLRAKSAGEATGGRKEGSAGLKNPRAGAGRTTETGVRNFHPTVKPVSLMRHLVRLVTPPNGTVLDPFMGSGTTGCACMAEHFDFVGMEQSKEYHAIATARITQYEADHDESTGLPL